jgi:chromosome segregation ATPase
MAAVSTAPGLPYFRFHSDTDLVSTLPDPRNKSNSKQHSTNGVSRAVHHPDLSSEVAALSNKLINAINHQTDLDDSLADTRHELEASRAQIRQLEAESQQHKDMLASGEWIKISDINTETVQLRTQIGEEQRARSTADKEKKAMEQELESLTGALFEEANEVGSLFSSKWYSLTISRWLQLHEKSEMLWRRRLSK